MIHLEKNWTLNPKAPLATHHTPEGIKSVLYLDDMQNVFMEGNEKILGVSVKVTRIYPLSEVFNRTYSNASAPMVDGNSYISAIQDKLSKEGRR